MTDVANINDITVSEADFQDQVVELAQRTGWKVMHTRPAMDRRGRWSTPLQGDPGYPDLTMVHEDRCLIVFAELKSDRKGADLSPAQRDWMGSLSKSALAMNQRMGFTFPPRACQVYVSVWRPSDWDEIEMVLVGGVL